MRLGRGVEGQPGRRRQASKGIVFKYGKEKERKATYGALVDGRRTSVLTNFILVSGSLGRKEDFVFAVRNQFLKTVVVSHICASRREPIVQICSLTEVALEPRASHRLDAGSVHFFANNFHDTTLGSRVSF